MPSRILKTPGDRAAWVRFLEGQELPLSVTAKHGEEKRRDRQNRFAFETYKQIAELMGDRRPSDVRAETKLQIGVPIMREESADFREKYDRILKPMPYETKLELMVEPMEFPVTSLMSVKAMTRYISEMLAHWDAQGAPVMLPDDLQ